MFKHIAMKSESPIAEDLVYISDCQDVDCFRTELESVELNCSQKRVAVKKLIGKFVREKLEGN
jgi:hypothetical protein